ncbi:hypothetical protein JCM10212_005403 [Sporobolomyces blumeae]
MGKLTGRIWVAGTLVLISFIGFSSQLFIVLPSYEHDWRDRELVKLLVPFNVLLALLYLNYALTVATDPGSIPKGWEPNWDAIETGQAEVKKLTGGPRFCRTCQAYKPPRAHHCRQCKRCVLKMDHHCPWVNNCVGHRNYGHFVRFLFYVDVACSWHLWMITKRAFGLSAFQRAPSTFQVIMLILNYTACVPVLLIVGVFSLFHFWSVLTNATTIEGWEKDKAASLKRRGKIREYRYPYHLGYLGNLKDVLGPNVLSWCWPQRAPGDGLTYRVGAGIDPREQYAWPPRDEFVRPRPRRPTKPLGSPFTYGTGLNPRLARSSNLTEVDGGRQSELRHRTAPAARSVERRRGLSRGSEGSSRSTSSSPSVKLSDYDDVDSPSGRRASHGETGSVSEDDDVPLGELASRRNGRPGSAGFDGNPSARRRVREGTDDEENDDDDETDYEEDDLDPDRSVRIRRGSEGYEIRPRFSRPPSLSPPLDDGRHPDPSQGMGSDWEEVTGDDARETWRQGGQQTRARRGYYDEEDDTTERDPYEEEMVSEGELDEDGDRRRRGPRYKYYVREEDSESDTEDEVEMVRGGDGF